QDMTDEPFDAPNRKSVAAVMGLWLFVFVVLMVDVHVVRSLRSERFLHARVTRTPFHLFVANRDHAFWRNVRVRVNGEYLCPPLTIDEFTVATIDLNTCTARGGDHYQPHTMFPASVLVTAVVGIDGRKAGARFGER